MGGPASKAQSSRLLVTSLWPKVTGYGCYCLLYLHVELRICLLVWAHLLRSVIFCSALLVTSAILSSLV